MQDNAATTYVMLILKHHIFIWIWVFILRIFVSWKLSSFAFCVSFGLISLHWNMNFRLVVGVVNAANAATTYVMLILKASELHLDLALNCIDICILKALFFCILFFLWTHFNTLDNEVWLGGVWSTRPPHTLYS